MPGIGCPPIRIGGVIMAAVLLVGPSLSMGGEDVWENPSGGAITHHALRARIDVSTAGLSVIDTLTIRHQL